MAKRKAAAKRQSAGRGRAGAKKAAPRRGGRKRTARQAHAKTAKKKVGRKAARTTPARKRAARGTAARKAAARKTPRATRKSAPAGRARKAVRRRPGQAARPRTAAPPRKAPALNRERRVVRDEEDLTQETPPSSLDMDRNASSARSGRRSLREKYTEHTETGPAITGGDVDADWESAYSVGDEAPGGDNPTPDQDIVDDIGRAVGVEYQDTEELKGADKLSKRDKNRWELDPASSEDWDER